MSGGRRSVCSLDEIAPFEVLDQPLERIEAVDALWRAVEDLNVDLKMALLLRDVVGLSYTEIADSLEITLATVKWRIYKAREEVQAALAREGIMFGKTAEAEAERAARRLERLASATPPARSDPLLRRASASPCARPRSGAAGSGSPSCRAPERSPCARAR